MRAQLIHLIKMCDHPALTLQILPFSAGAYRAGEHSFTIIQYAHPGTRDIVIARGFGGPVLSESLTETEFCLQLFEDASAKAELARSAKVILERILSELDGAHAQRC